MSFRLLAARSHRAKKSRQAAKSQSLQPLLPQLGLVVVRQLEGDRERPRDVLLAHQLAQPPKPPFPIALRVGLALARRGPHRRQILKGAKLADYPGGAADHVRVDG